MTSRNQCLVSWQGARIRPFVILHFVLVDLAEPIATFPTFDAAAGPIRLRFPKAIQLSGEQLFDLVKRPG
jgi:hypothetical protein